MKNPEKILIIVIRDIIGMSKFQSPNYAAKMKQIIHPSLLEILLTQTFLKGVTPQGLSSSFG